MTFCDLCKQAVFTAVNSWQQSISIISNLLCSVVNAISTSNSESLVDSISTTPLSLFLKDNTEILLFNLDTYKGDLRSKGILYQSKSFLPPSSITAFSVLSNTSCAGCNTDVSITQTVKPNCAMANAVFATKCDVPTPPEAP